MKFLKTGIVAGAVFAGMTGLTATAQATNDTLLIPERAIILGGDKSGAGTSKLISVLYDTEELRFNDPQAPRFLFIDREGRMALGIGGYIKGTLQYDFAGAIDNGADFRSYNIPVPSNPALRNQFYANARHSTLFLKMVGKKTQFGYFTAYIQTNFGGGGTAKYLELQKAFISLGNLTGGLAPSTFQDGGAGVPTIDNKGASGTITANNVLVQYRPHIGKHITLAVSIEMPTATYTLNESTEMIKQRVPDIPVFAQYSYDNGRSHVRLSGLLRQLSYRDLIKNENRTQMGWAVQLSGIASLPGNVTLFYQGAYGKGYQRYINDLENTGLDLIPSQEPGRLQAPGALAVVGGIKYQPTRNLFVSSSYSQNRLYNQTQMPTDTYRYGQYIVANAFYTIFPEMQLGIEYIHGTRTNINGDRGAANRIMAMFQYSF